MSETSKHIITVESTQLYRGGVSAEMAELLTNDGVRQNKPGVELSAQSPSLEFHEELKITYECSCGRRFRKGATAREHLETTEASNE